MLYYRLIRPFARIAIRTFYKKIYLTGLENYPADKPVIFALNHPTAFVEPCILATTLPEELHFLVRGDFFRQPLHNNLLRGFGCLPVFRMKDGGYGGLKNNYDTFEVTFKTLRAGEPIVILAEGTTVHEKRLRPLKKGTARLAFGTMERYGAETDVHIVPVGVNYTYAEQFRSEVMIEFNRPVRAADYWESYRDNNARGIKELTDELRTRLEEKVIIIEDEEDEDLVEKQLILSRNGKPRPVLPILSGKGYRFKAEKRIADTVNQLSESEKIEKSTAVNVYFNRLKQLKISDIGMVRAHRYGLGQRLLLWIGFLPAAAGYLLNSPPLLLTGYIGKNKVKYIEFQAPVMITVGIVAWLLWWTLLLLTGILLKNALLILTAVMMPLLGWFSLVYREFSYSFREAKKAEKIPEKEMENLLNLRQEILL